MQKKNERVKLDMGEDAAPTTIRQPKIFRGRTANPLNPDLQWDTMAYFGQHHPSVQQCHARSIVS